MNAFIQFTDELRQAIGNAPDIELVIDEPASRSARSMLSITASDGYSIEVEWSRHLGFGIAAGFDLAFGSGIDEVFGSAEAARQRVCELLSDRTPTRVTAPLELAELRKLCGVLQKDAADRLGISKSGLAQIEGSRSLATLQIATLKKVVESLGGELVVTARFPEGRERQISVG